MCCFSAQVKHVAETSIFCRMGPKGSQVVIYSMVLEADQDLAMVLPIPVAEERDEASVAFLNLSLAADFFTKLDRAFPLPMPRQSASNPFAAAASPPKLKVESVGSFEASFVPRAADFERLDERFRLPSGVWENLPQIADHGFVVFKLKAGRARVHPMAFAYPAKDRSKLVFPTLHIHDGSVDPKADFDHSLYCQSESSEVRKSWQESVALAAGYVNPGVLRGSVLGDRHVYKRQIVGEFANADLVAAAI